MNRRAIRLSRLARAAFGPGVLVIERGVSRRRVELSRDSFTRPTDSERRYSPADIANWGSDWYFIHVRITSAAGATEISGIEYGQSLHWRVTACDILFRADEEGWWPEPVQTHGQGA